VRSLRAALIAALAAAAGLGQAAAQPAAASASYLPLAVGRSWTYRCSVEGEASSSKTIRIVGREAAGGEVRYRAQLVTSDGPMGFLMVERPGQGVFSDEQAPGDPPQPLLPADPKPGAALQGWRLVGPHPVKLPGGRTVQALRVENFDVENPDLSYEETTRWRARDYVRGIGMVQESDGTGASCLLTSRK
jgi:hypothetical protein